MFREILTPTVLIDRGRVQANINAMQAICNAHGVELWPHIKTHKMVEVARMQLAAGACGLVCSKIGEAEVMLRSGVRRMFLAYGVVDPLNAPRLRALASKLDELILACTSIPQAEALEQVLEAAELTAPVMVSVDTGLGREGARGVEGAVALAEAARKMPRMVLRGFYSHEGQAYGSPEESDAIIKRVRDMLDEARNIVDPALPIWPGCSVTAARMATMPGVNAVRPGTYVFGDLSLAARHHVMTWDSLAATMLTTVVDRPEPGLALLDAGSKALSSDKNAKGVYAADFEGRDIQILRCSEEHGWATGSDVDSLRVGDRLRLVPAHICPLINLADQVAVIEGDEIVGLWRVDARGMVR